MRRMMILKRAWFVFCLVCIGMALCLLSGCSGESVGPGPSEGGSGTSDGQSSSPNSPDSSNGTWSAGVTPAGYAVDVDWKPSDGDFTYSGSVTGGAPGGSTTSSAGVNYNNGSTQVDVNYTNSGGDSSISATAGGKLP